MNDLLTNQPDPTPQFDPNKNYYDELVGDAGKYKTNEDLAKSRVQADLHIYQIEKENKELRDIAETFRKENMLGPSLRETLDQLNSKITQLSSTPQPLGNEGVTPPMQNQPLDLGQLKSLVSTEFMDLQRQQVESQNFNVVQAKLIERYGANYATHYKQAIENLGISNEYANTLAKTSPQAFISMLKLDNQPRESFQSPPRTGIKAENFSPNVPKRTWDYYQKMKVSNPKLYRDTKTIAQMNADYADLGDAFEDGDFHSR